MKDAKNTQRIFKQSFNTHLLEKSEESEKRRHAILRNHAAFSDEIFYLRL